MIPKGDLALKGRDAKAMLAFMQRCFVLDPSTRITASEGPVLYVGREGERGESTSLYYRARFVP